MASTASELIWIKQLLADIGIEAQNPMKIFCDNQATRHLASNFVFHERTKHIEVDCHFIREKVQAKKIETPYVKSEDQLAYIFTKGLDMGPFGEKSHKLGMIDIYNPTRGGVLRIIVIRVDLESVRIIIVIGQLEKEESLISYLINK
jgi:hypothetical protein